MQSEKTCKKCGRKFTGYKDHRLANCPDCRHPYGRTKEQKLKDILESIKHKAQKETFERWCEKRTTNNMSLEGTIHRMYSLRLFAEVLNKPFEKATEQDLIKVMGHKTLRTYFYRKLVKQFFKEIGNPAAAAWINTNKTKDEINPRRAILQDEEIKKIIDNTCNQRDRTMISIIAENPTRPKDITNLKVGDVVADEYGFELQMRSKTASGMRKVRLINSAPDFRIYWNSLPQEYKDDKQHALFYQYANSRYGKPLGWAGLQGALQTAVKRAKINKPVSLYDFRRTTATNLLLNPAYTASEVQVMGGWSSIKMFDIYGRVTDNMVNQKKLFEQAKEDPKLLEGMKARAKKDKTFAIAMKKSGLLGEKEIIKDILRPVACPRCQTLNTATAISCSSCWLPLKKEAIDIKEKVISKSVQNKAAITKDMIKEALREMIKGGEIKL